MKKYFDSLINTSGAPVVAASISVYNYGTTTLASLFADAAGATTLANPLTSSSAGYFEFYAADGRYTLSISVGGYPVTTISDILLDDPTNASATVVVGGSVDNSPIGASTPSSGAFTTLSASSSVSGTGFVNYMASPPAIGGAEPNTGKFTDLTTTGNATLGDASTDIHTINGVLIQSSVGAGGGITTGGNLTVRSPDGVEGGQIALTNRANTAAAFVVDVDNVDQCRVYTAQNNTNITIGQIGGATGGSVVIHTGSTERVKIDSSGNVGIGAAPTYDLDISKTKTGTALVSRVYNAGTGAGSEASLRVTQGVVSGTISAQGDSALYIGASSNHPVLLLQNSVEVLRIGTTKEVLVANPAGLGYGTGAGGTVTQATSKSTAVTLNKPCGQITMHNAALAAGASVYFSLVNSIIGSADTLAVHPVFFTGTAGNEYEAWVSYLVAGQAVIGVRNNTAGSRSDPLILNFAVIKGATA